MSKAIVDTIREIIARADECKANNGSSDFEAGRLLAFNEVLSIIKTDFIGEPDVEAVLAFDIDERYSYSNIRYQAPPERVGAF